MKRITLKLETSDEEWDKFHHDYIGDGWTLHDWAFGELTQNVGLGNVIVATVEDC